MAPSRRRTSNAGIKLIKDHEGLSLTAFKDPLGSWVIGWGHNTGVNPGDFINKEIAETLLLLDVQRAEDVIHQYVKVPLNQSMFDALVSFVFNVERDAFLVSRLLQKLNEGEYLAAADQFPFWVFHGGVRFPGLVRRRAMELGMFLSEYSIIHNYIVSEVQECSNA